MEIAIYKKGGMIPGTDSQSSLAPSYEYYRLNYTAHVANEGWKDPVESPADAGSAGSAHQIEALTVNLPDELKDLGNLSISAHVANKGWLEAVGAGETAGTTGEALRMEGIKISLTGQLAENYDIYYRTYVQGLGWLGWTRNGGLAGSEGCSRWIEGIQIDIVTKAYQKYTLSQAYTTIKNSASTATLVSILSGDLGAGFGGFGGLSVPWPYRDALSNEVTAIQSTGHQVGFVMIDLATGKGVSYNPDTKYFSASSIKGLYIGALLAQNRTPYYTDRGDIQSILHTSSNILYEQLFYKYGNTYIRNWCNEVGLEWYVGDNLYSNYSARDMAKLWVKMNEFFNSGDYGNEVGTWYQDPNRSPIHSQLGGRYTTRSKAGWVAESGYSATADGGIIYSSNGAYIITVISNMPASLDRLNGIVNILESVHSSMN